MKLSICNVSDNIVKQDERYTVKDNNTLSNLVVSSTELKPNKSTTGHSHEGQEEVYYMVSGFGRIEIGTTTYTFGPGDVFLIEDGKFHRVHAEYEGAYFVCILQGRRSH